MSKVTKELLIKTGCYFVATCVLMVIIKYSGLLDIIKTISQRATSGTSIPLNMADWLLLIGYRLLIYFAIPLLVSIIELIFVKKKRHISWVVLNLEAHFIAISIVCGLYYLFALDYVVGTKILTIEHSLTSLLLLFFTVTLGKTFPHIFIPNEKEAFPELDK